MLVKILLSVSYFLVLLGSIGMVLFSTKFSFATSTWEHKNSDERICSLNGQQVWIGSWLFIIIGTLGQLLACWL